MISAGAHVEFIAWAYAGVGLMVAGVIAWVAWDSRRVKARLAALEKAGIRRRSAGQNS